MSASNHMNILFPTGADVSKDSLRKSLASGVANVQGFGAAADGATDDAGPFGAAKGSGGAVFCPPGVYRIGSDLFVEDCLLMPGAVLKPDAGKTVTVTRTFTAPRMRCIDGDGEVQILQSHVLPHWWGALGLGGDDTAAISRAMARHDRIHLPWGIYGLSGPLPLRKGMAVTGEPWSNSYIDWSLDWQQAEPGYAGRASMLQYVAGTGAQFTAADDTTFRDLVFRVGRARLDSDRFMSAHAAHVNLWNCKFENLAKVICDDTLGHSFGAIMANSCRFDGCGTAFAGPLVDCVFQGNVFNSCNCAFDLTAGGGLNTIVGNRFEWGVKAIQCYQTRPGIITGNMFDAHEECAVKLHSAHNQTISGNFLWRNGRNGAEQMKRSHLVFVEDVQACHITGNTFLRGGADGSTDADWPRHIVEFFNCANRGNTWRGNQSVDGCSSYPFSAPNWDAADCLDIDEVDVKGIGDPGGVGDEFAEIAKRISYVVSAPVDIKIHESRRMTMYTDLYGRKARFVGARPGLSIDLSAGHVGGVLDVLNLTMQRAFGQQASSMTANAAPALGSWKRGQIVWNSEPYAGGPVGWICIADGAPGTWKAFGTISA